MAPFISVKPIIPTQFLKAASEASMRDALDRAFADEAQETVLDLEDTTATWKHKPKFIIRVKADGFSREVYTDSDIYRYVSRGTRVRYATMSPDFQAKTTPGVRASRPGRGRMLFVSRRRPRPGIKARNFEELVRKRSEGRMGRRVNEAIRNAFRKR